MRRQMVTTMYNNSLNLHKKTTNSRILVVIVKWRHRAIVQFRQKVLGEISARLSHLSNFFKCIGKRKRNREILTCVYIGVCVAPVRTCKMLTQMKVKGNENHSISRVGACAAFAFLESAKGSSHWDAFPCIYTLRYCSSLTNLLPFPFALR